MPDAPFVAFLRSINVGGRRVTNDELAQIVSGAGLKNVAPFLASGNLVFEAPAAAQTSTLSATIADALEAGLGYPVPTYVRTLDEVSALAAAEPFTEAEIAGSVSNPQVTLLAKRPTPKAWKAALALATDDDLIGQGEQEWFWLPRLGVSGSKLNMGAVERSLGPGTTRTLNTIRRAQAKLVG